MRAEPVIANDHYFEHGLGRIHYYVFGHGPKKMLCFHGFGMHGRQFKLLEQALGHRYTFYGFDLFFHKGTVLHQRDLRNIKLGLRKEALAELIASFCEAEGIDRFSMIAYSMGTHYASSIAELMADRIDEYIAVAPSFLAPGKLVTFLSRSTPGNKLFEKLMLSKKGLLRTLKLIRFLGILDQKGYDILYKEIATPELRFDLYACATFMRHLITHEKRFMHALNEAGTRTLFIFGKRDRFYPPGIGKKLSDGLDNNLRVTLDADHELINLNLARLLVNELT